MDMMTTIAAFIYIIGHWMGEKVASLIQYTSGVLVPPTIVDTIGILVTLTIFLIMVDIARKIVWTIVIVGWLFVILRIVALMVF